MALTAEQARRLERLQNRATCWEVAAIRGEERVLVAYVAQHSRAGILKAVQSRGQVIVDALGLPGDVRIFAAEKAVLGFTLGEWCVRFTCRTERQAILEGELPYVGEMVL